MEVLLGTISIWGGLEEEEDLVEWRVDWTRLSKEVDKGTLKCRIEISELVEEVWSIVVENARADQYLSG